MSENEQKDAAREFLDTLGEAPEPEPTRVLKVPEVVPVIRRGPATADDPTGSGNDAGGPDTAPDGGDPGATGALGALVEPALEGSDAEAYAALKARRAERRRKKLIKRGIIAGVAAGVLALGGIAIAVMNRPADQTMEPVTDFVTSGTFSTSIDANGSLQPLSSTVVTPEVDGQIATVNVQAGQNVKKGDVLFTIKNDELDRAVAQAGRELNIAKKNLDDAKKAQAAGAAAASLMNQVAAEQDGSRASTVKLAIQAMLDHQSKGANAISPRPRLIAGRAPLPGTSTLHQAGGATEGSYAAGNTDISPEELRAITELEAAQEAYDLAVAKAEARTVRAPIDGSIVALNAQVGAKLSDLAAGGANGAAGGPLVQIADLSKMKVTVQVGEEDISQVAVDQTASITCPAFPELMLTGRVTAIASIATGDPSMMSYDGSSSPSFAVDILIDEPDGRLKPGMTAQVMLTTQQLDGVVMVPVTALQTDDGMSHYVNVETDPETHAAERVDVEVAAQSDDLAVVGRMPDAPASSNPDMPESPLKDGDVLVIAGGMGMAGGEALDGAMGGGMAVM